MSAEYDPIVRQYRRSKVLPFRVCSEIPNHLESLGPLEGLSVLDVACGEGFYTRLIRERGAARVVGVDISSEMIALAEKQERDRPLGIRYVATAAEQMPDLESFDIVTTAFLLNTAATREILGEMARSLAAKLRPGGRLVVTLGDLCRWPDVDYSRYGMATRFPEPLVEGAPYRITFLLEEDSITITDFAWSHETCERVLSDAGFEKICWLTPTITPDGISRFGADYWETYLRFPPIVRIEARRKVR